MTVKLRPMVKIMGMSYYLCGRMLTKRQFACGIEGAPEWTLSGAVYCIRNPPTSIRDMTFIPWVLPIPTLRSDGCSDIEIIAQVGKDISDVLSQNVPPTSNIRYVGAIRYSVLIKRQSDWHARSVHIGEILRTDDPCSFVIRLHAMPFLLAEPDGVTGRIIPIMALVADVPTKIYAQSTYYRSQKNKSKEAQDGQIIGAAGKQLL
jgi:hypothetical protein